MQHAVPCNALPSYYILIIMGITTLTQSLPLTALSTSPKRLVVFYLGLMFFKSMFLESVSNKYVLSVDCGPGMGLSPEDTTKN